MGNAADVSGLIARATRPPAGGACRVVVLLGTFLFAVSGVIDIPAALNPLPGNGTFVWLALVVSLIGTATVLLGIARQVGTTHAAMRDWLRHYRRIFVLALGVGVLAELAPDRFAIAGLEGLYAWPWELLAWGVVCGLLILAVLDAASLIDAFAVLAGGLWIWAISAGASGQILLTVWPHPPAAFLAVYPQAATWSMFHAMLPRVMSAPVYASAGSIIVLAVWLSRIVAVSAWSRTGAELGTR